MVVPGVDVIGSSIARALDDFGERFCAASLQNWNANAMAQDLLSWRHARGKGSDLEGPGNGYSRDTMA